MMVPLVCRNLHMIFMIGLGICKALLTSLNAG